MPAMKQERLDDIKAMVSDPESWPDEEVLVKAIEGCLAEIARLQRLPTIPVGWYWTFYCKVWCVAYWRGDIWLNHYGTMMGTPGLVGDAVGPPPGHMVYRQSWSPTEGRSVQSQP